MKTVKFRLKGDYGHFKIPYTNNNPLTYPFITKTALVGMLGAVIGIERNDFKRLFPLLCDSLKYSVSLNGTLNKESISNYAYNFNNFKKPDRPNKSPKPMEYIKNLDLDVYVVYFGENEEVKNIFDNYIDNLVNEVYIWKPTLGIKQCSCEIENVIVGESTKKNGVFKTKTFVGNLSDFDDNIVIHKDNIPTHQDENWFNDSERNVDVYFSENGNELTSKGDYLEFNNCNIYVI